MLAGIITPLLWLTVMVAGCLVAAVTGSEVTPVDYAIIGTLATGCVGYILNILWKGRKS